MKRHTITEEEVMPAITGTKVQLAGSYGSGQGKTLYWLPVQNGNSSYMVISGGELVKETMFLDVAIAAYNDLP